MNEITYRRITDWNNSLYGLDLHTSFEAGFQISEDKALIFSGRIIDSHGREIFRSRDLSDLDEEVLQRYHKWNPSEELQELIDAIASQNIKDEPVWFVAPTHEITLEIKGPVVSQETFGVIVSMSKFMVLGEYHWKDSGCITISLLCKKEELLQFFQDLKKDLSHLLNQSNF